MNRLNRSLSIMMLVAATWVAGLLSCVPVSAAPPAPPITPTYVSAGGADSRGCTFSAPCRTFAGALPKTSVGGDVIVLDSGEYGPVTITQSVSIVAPAGVYAAVTVPSGNGITVNGSGTRVVLRGLTVKGPGGTYGIYFQSGSVLHIENCHILEMTSRGINMEANGKLFVTDTVVRDGQGIGVAAPATAAATFTRVQIKNTLGGLALEGGTIVVRESVITNNISRAVIVQPVAPVNVTVERSTISANTTRGVSVIGPGSMARVVIVDSTISDNTVDGIEVADGTTVIISRNTITGNGDNGINNAGSVVKTTGDNTISDNVQGDVSGSLTPLPSI